MECPSCGAKLARGMLICPRCGTVLPYNTLPPEAENDEILESFGPFQESTAPLSPSQRQPLSRPMLLLSTTVALLLMLSGMSLIYYTAIAHPAQLRSQATATVQTILTSNAHSTAIANTQATGTAQAFANATATAQAQAQATVTALQALYTQVTSGTPALASTLAFQDGVNWDVYSTPDGGGCNFSNGALHASVFTKNYYVPCLAHNSSFTNFAYQVQMTMLEGDEGGLMVRSDDANNHFYVFSIGHDGTYRFYVVKDNNNSLSLVDDTSSIIKTGAGQSNTLTLIAQGATFYLYINQQYVASASDTSFASGEVGVAASDTTNNTDVAFTNAKVWSL